MDNSGKKIIVGLIITIVVISVYLFTLKHGPDPSKI